MKKKIAIILCILCTFILLSNKVNVVYGASSDNGNASFTVKETSASFATDYTSYKTEVGETNYLEANYKQRVHVFTQTQSENSKVVTWAVARDNGRIKLMTVAAIAADYEKTHPGWTVVGGINADQYVTGFGTNIPSQGKDYYYPQPYYPMICDGEGWFIMTGIPVSGSQNIIAILQDGTNDPLVNGRANIKSGNIKITGLYLYILDENGKRTNKFQISKVNETPRETETTLWTSHYNEKEEFPDITVYGNLYVVENAERAYASNSIDYTYKGDNAKDAFFGKGTISELASSATIGYGDFAIDTKDEFLKSKLKEGSKILVQYEMEGIYPTVESAIGYHTIHRMDDKDLTTSSSYNISKYPRSLIGRTNDGKIVLMAIDQKEYSGANFDETNAILKHYGVVEAYQMDGGGSVTAVIRDGNGFKVVNSPRDGSPRSVFSALLVVERKTETESTVKARELKLYNYVLNSNRINIKKRNKFIFKEKMYQ